MPPRVTRRSVLAGGCGAACALALTGCATYGAGAPTPAPAPAPAGGGPVVLAATADIPVGGGRVFADRDIVVTQPVAGEFTAFSATCTHQGCLVSEVADGTINCPCHGSRFAVADGAVTAGPAGRPLPGRAVRVEGDAVVLA
jgi:Rieske Fe-S protein